MSAIQYNPELVPLRMTSCVREHESQGATEEVEQESPLAPDRDRM
eukprot:SAG31_NODE_872_length_11329_cov_3.968655_15_plen_44_part_01